MLFDTLNPVQIAYHVPDPEAAAREYSRTFGWGPFFLMEHIELVQLPLPWRRRPNSITRRPMDRPATS